jgi:hypothetical protein
MHSFRREVKLWVPCRRFTTCKRSLNAMWKSGIFRINLLAISRPHNSHIWLLGSLEWRRKLETSKLQGYISSFLCLGGVAARNWWRQLESPIRG